MYILAGNGAKIWTACFIEHLLVYYNKLYVFVVRYREASEGEARAFVRPPTYKKPDRSVFFVFL